MLPDYPIRGYEYYDYRHDVVNTTFRNYKDNATRKTGALSYLMFTSAGVSTENSIERAKFINAKPVYFPVMERKWGNDNLNGVAWKAAVIHDKDGSVSGVPNSYILLNDGVYDSIATDAKACRIKRDWNAAVCKGDIGRLTFTALGGGIGAPPAAGAPDRPSSLGAGAVIPITVLAVRPPAQPPEYTQTASNVRAGTEIKVTTERPKLDLTLTEMDAGSWVIFDLPGFTTAAAGTEQGSLDTLRKANDTSYFKDKDELWVKVVSNGEGARGASPGIGTSLQVSR